MLDRLRLGCHADAARPPFLPPAGGKRLKIVDLTLPLPPGLKTNPTHPETIITDHVTHWFTAPRYQSPCKGYASKLLLICDHIGTHLDAPLHFIPEGKSMDAVPLENTLGEAIFLDLSDKPADQPVTVEIMEKKLAAKGEQIKPGDIVLLRTWPGKWGDAIFKAAGISWPAAKWLCARKIKSVGLDLPNADTGGDMQRPCHMELLGNEIGIIENLVNLDKLTKTRFFFIGLPLHFIGLTASPIRAIAVEEW
jgi:kynurenine formamidase